MTALLALPSEGVIPDQPGGLVRSVLPGGLAWRDGIRPGQRVVALRPGARPEDWELRTTDGQVEFGSSVRGDLAEIRDLAPLALLALLAGLAALAAFTRWPRAAAVLGALAATGGLLPLWASGDGMLTLLAALGLPLFPAAVVMAFGGRWRRLRLGAPVALGLVAIAWLAARYFVPGAFDAIDTLRASLLWLLWLAVLATTVDWGRYGRYSALDRVTRLDVALLALAGGVLAGVWLLVQPPFYLLAVAIGIMVLGYGRWRRRVMWIVDQLLVASVRDQASVAASEDERARLARQIHDAPLQALSGVIRRLEVQPATAADIEVLREAAEQLREVTSELHPPVLEDLGLGPALAHLVEQIKDRNPIPLEAHLVDATTLAAASRLPREVELALYRIVQEALTNAQLHSRATSIRVLADLAPEAADIEVVDDGEGFRGGDVREAQGTGHFGISFMRQRAAHIGARLRIAPGRPRGTVVQVSWRQR